jgi:allantoinase
MTQKPNPGFAWPENARIVGAVTCLLENWSGDKGPPFSVQTTSLKPGTHDRAAMTWGTYGGRAGVWRLLKILDDNDVPATFVANAHSRELAQWVRDNAITEWTNGERFFPAR